VGEEPEVEVAPVRTPGWIDALTSIRNCKTLDLSFRALLIEGASEVELALRSVVHGSPESSTTFSAACLEAK